MDTTQTHIPGFYCGICLDPLTDDDCKHNYSNHEHSGYWCDTCLRSYSMPRAEALKHLRTRLHKLSQLSVNS